MIDRGGSTNAPCPARADVRCAATMQTLMLRAALAVSIAVIPGTAAYAKPTDPIREAELAAHISVLAGDALEGRAPGTEGEDRTIAYIVGEWAKAGLVPVPGSATPWVIAATRPTVVQKRSAAFGVTRTSRTGG